LKQEFDVGGGYRVNTGQAVLAMAFERLLPQIRDLIDVPPELRRAGKDVKAIMSGKWDPDVESMDLEDQARIAVPLMNAVRLLAEPHGNKPPRDVRAKSERIARLMLRVDPAVAWVAIRNSLAWEASNRPTQFGKGYDWWRLWVPHIQAIPIWFEVFVRIRKKAFS